MLGLAVLIIVFVGINWLLMKAREKAIYVKSDSYYQLYKKHSPMITRTVPSEIKMETGKELEKEITTSPQLEDNYCPHCGWRRIKDAIFCSSCGGKL